MYDIFYVSDKDVNALDWLDFQSRFPNAQLVENCNSFEILKNKSLTKHFWVVWDNLKIQKDFDFNYRIPEWDTDYIHVFQISGMILLIAMIGAIVLTFRKREGVKTQSYLKQISRERSESVEVLEVPSNKGVKIDD